MPPLKRGQSATIPISADPPMQQSDDGKCTYEERTTVTGSISVTRTK